MTDKESLSAWTSHAVLKKWIEEAVELCQPSSLWLCDGSEGEYEALCRYMVQAGTLIPLNPQLHPHCFLARSNPDDVARVEECTFICSESESDSGPTNNWCAPDKMRGRLAKLFQGCMRGRTLYVIPFSMGPVGSPLSHIGVQITDSPYVVCSMRIMTRMGSQVLECLGENGFFVPCMHSVGVPLTEGGSDVPWPCNTKDRVIAHFPNSREIWSFGSGYGGNALLGKKCFALRIASWMGYQGGWLAEHMLILGLTSPEGKKKYIAASFPSACGKTNLAMLTPTLPGWKVETVGDDIAWMRFAEDGRLYAINPEAGMFGVAPGTSETSNPNALASCRKNTLFTNVALTPQGDVWWEGLTSPPPPLLTSWLGEPWTPSSGKKAAHPNSRFTAPLHQCPCIDPAYEKLSGVPISAILFGGRRATTLPLVLESFSWQHGVFMGACISSETTAAATGAVGKLRHDPFAMLPFCGYHMGDYFAHWLKLGRGEGLKLPRIYSVNWFRQGADGKWLWPGFGENCRVLKWIFERDEGMAGVLNTPVGGIPAVADFDIMGLKLAPEDVRQLFAIDKAAWEKEGEMLKEYFTLFEPKMPLPLKEELQALQRRLKEQEVSSPPSKS